MHSKLTDQSNSLFRKAAAKKSGRFGHQETKTSHKVGTRQVISKNQGTISIKKVNQPSPRKNKVSPTLQKKMPPSEGAGNTDNHLTCNQVTTQDPIPDWVKATLRPLNLHSPCSVSFPHISITHQVLAGRLCGALEETNSGPMGIKIPFRTDQRYPRISTEQQDFGITGDSDTSGQGWRTSSHDKPEIPEQVYHRDIILPGDFMIKVDLKDAYFSIPIHPSPDVFELLEFTCLPFGLSSAPHTFTKVMKPFVTLDL